MSLSVATITARLVVGNEHTGAPTKILIAVDSSPFSQKVLEEAAARPWPPDTTFCIVSAVDVGRFAELPALIDDSKRECEAILKAGSELLARANRSATTQVLIGFPRKIVSAYASQWGADLILVGSHGRGAIGRFFLGSVAKGILQTATCSVEIVRFPPDGHAPSSRPMKILLAADGSDSALSAARSVGERPWPGGTIVKILSVEEIVPTPMPLEVSSLAPIYPQSLVEELITTAHARATGAVEAVRNILSQAATGVSVQSLTPSGDPRGVILDTSEAWPADLIVLGSHGLRGFDRFLIGSVAETVAVHAHCSVQVVRRPGTSKK